MAVNTMKDMQEKSIYGKIQCIKLCVYSHKQAVKTQQIIKIVTVRAGEFVCT